MGIFADIGQTGTHERKGLAFRSFLDLHQSFNRLLMKQIATNTITGIRWITDNRPGLQVLDNLLNQALLRIIGINIYKHGFLFPLSEKTSPDKNGLAPKKV
jgi:hypothetical protein